MDISPIELPGERAAYLELADHLVAGIGSGLYAPGAKIPSIAQLREAAGGLSAETVRKAIDLVKSKRLLSSQPGRGVYVRVRPVYVRDTKKRYQRALWAAGTSAGQADQRAGVAFGRDTEQVAVIEADAELAERLEVGVGAKAIVRRRRYTGDDTPFQHAVSFLPHDVFERTAVELPDSGPGGSWARAEELGWRFTRAVEEVEDREADGDEADVLGLDPLESVYEIRRYAYAVRDGVERVLDYSVIVLPAASTVLRYEVPIV